jgi:nitroreductase
LQLPEVKAFVGLPENGEVLGIFYMGYPEDGAWPKSHRKPLEYVTDWNE